MRFVKCAKKSIIFLCLASLLTALIFVSFNRPLKVKADVLATTGLALGGAVLLSYFASMGIELVFNGSSSTSLEEYANSIIADYETSTGTVNSYFDSEGTFIGTEEDLNIILSDQSQAYWNMGKDMASWLESVKDWYVTENSLEVGTQSQLYNYTSISLQSGDYTFIPSSQFISSSSPYTSITSPLPSAIPLDGSSTIYLTDSIVLNTSCQRVNGSNSSRVYFTYELVHLESGTVIQTVSRNVQNIQPVSTYEQGYTPFFAFHDDGNGNLIFSLFSWYAEGYYYRRDSMNLGNISNLFSVSDISLEGSLTDGYSDYENALNQGLTDQADNENASVAVGVGSVGDALTAEQVKQAILEALAANTYSGTLTGVYEDQATAEEDLEGEKEFSPSYPEGWVVVNGLEDFFPFCIPFDLYALICLFNAEPEAPQFDLHFDFAGIMPEQDITLDFSQFEFLARIVRVLVVIGFVIFLIIKTRDMIRG